MSPNSVPDNTHVRPEDPANLEEKIEALLREAGDLSPKERAELREWIRIDYQYLGDCVAYIDTWDGPEDAPRLTRRVVAHDPSQFRVTQEVDKLPAEQRAQVHFTRAEDPERDYIESLSLWVVGEGMITED